MTSAAGFSAIFIRRPVGTTLLTLGLALAGFAAFWRLPVAPLPQVDYPTIVVSAQMAGASPETMATSVATPLERYLGVIADVSEMTSSSTVGSTRIVLQFSLSRDIEGAARDVQAAINAARADLPATLRSNPTYRKVNPADAPIMILSLTSDTRTRGQIYDEASMILVPALSQIDGVGQVTIGGGAARAVRIEVDPAPLFHHGIGLEDVRAAIAAANAHSPKGAVEDGGRRWQLYANDQATVPDDYKPLVIAYRNGAPVRLSDVAKIEEGQESRRNVGLSNGKPAVLVILYRRPGGNIIDAVDQVTGMLPQLRAALPSDIDLTVALDRSTTIRASLREVEITLAVAVVLVILVVFVFLRNARAALIPSVAVPVSLLGTFGAMHLLGYSLNNSSLMALTIATGFVVDDAIVVLENVTRHVESGMSRIDAALRGTREIAFTVVSMTLSLLAVFVPILLMPGLIGRIFREFAVVLSVAILISMIVSLTATPMMCAYWATDRPERRSRWNEASDRIFAAMLRLLRAYPGSGAAPSGAGADHARSGRRAQCLSLRRDPEGAVPAAGYRASGGRDPRRSERLVRADAGQAGAVHPHYRRGSGGRQRHRIYRRRADELRVCLHRAEAVGRARRLGRPGRRALAAQARAGRGGAPVSAAGAGYSGRRAGVVRPVPVHAAG